jgi:hypothetical protein
VEKFFDLGKTDTAPPIVAVHACFERDFLCARKIEIELPMRAKTPTLSMFLAVRKIRGIGRDDARVDRA